MRAAQKGASLLADLRQREPRMGILVLMHLRDAPLWRQLYQRLSNGVDNALVIDLEVGALCARACFWVRRAKPVRPALTSEPAPQVCRSINLFLFGRLMENVCATVSSPLRSARLRRHTTHATH